MNRSRLLAISLGGMAGASLRWSVLDTWPTTDGAFPWPVFAVNVFGSVILGMALAEEWDHPRWRLVLHDGVGIGLCGGLTTFSTFAVEVSMLAKRGHGGSAVAYVMVSLVMAVIGVFAGAAFLRGARSLTFPVEDDGEGPV